MGGVEEEMGGTLAPPTQLFADAAWKSLVQPLPRLTVYGTPVLQASLRDGWRWRRRGGGLAVGEQRCTNNVRVEREY